MSPKSGLGTDHDRSLHCSRMFDPASPIGETHRCSITLISFQSTPGPQSHLIRELLDHGIEADMLPAAKLSSIEIEAVLIARSPVLVVPCSPLSERQRTMLESVLERLGPDQTRWCEPPMTLTDETTYLEEQVKQWERDQATVRQRRLGEAQIDAALDAIDYTSAAIDIEELRRAHLMTQAQPDASPVELTPANTPPSPNDRRLPPAEDQLPWPVAIGIVLGLITVLVLAFSILHPAP